MHSATGLTPNSTHPPQAAKRPQRLVVDAPTRMFHWLFALNFAGAYLTADGERWRALHVSLGYTLAGLLVFRVLYGLLGPRHAGLGAMLRKLASAPAWLRSLGRALPLALRGTPDQPDLASRLQGLAQAVNWRQGQNLLMATAVVALLLMAAPLTLSGYGSYNDWGDVLGGDCLEDVHEFLGEAFLAVVLLHLALIAGLSLLRGKNQALPMLTGRTEGPGPDLVKRPRHWLAAQMLAAVLGFMVWQHLGHPQGLLPSAAASQPGDHGAHGDDDDD